MGIIRIKQREEAINAYNAEVVEQNVEKMSEMTIEKTVLQKKKKETAVEKNRESNERNEKHTKNK